MRGTALPRPAHTHCPVALSAPEAEKVPSPPLSLDGDTSISGICLHNLPSPSTVGGSGAVLADGGLGLLPTVPFPVSRNLQLRALQESSCP